MPTLTRAMTRALQQQLDAEESYGCKLVGQPPNKTKRGKTRQNKSESKTRRISDEVSQRYESKKRDSKSKESYSAFLTKVESNLDQNSEYFANIPTRASRKSTAKATALPSSLGKKRTSQSREKDFSNVPNKFKPKNRPITR